MTNSAVPLSSTKQFSIFQLTVFVLQPPTLLFWFRLTALTGVILQRKSSNKPTAHYLLSAKRQISKVSNQLVNIVEHLAA